MTAYRTVLACVGFAVVLLTGALSHQAPNRERTPIDGVWEYINPGMRGLSFFTEGHYVHVATPSDLPAIPAGALADSVRARLYAGLTLDAGTFSVADSIVTARREYSKDPRQVGVTWRWSFRIHGDTCTYHTLNAAGQVTGTGRAVRVSMQP